MKWISCPRCASSNPSSVATTPLPPYVGYPVIPIFMLRSRPFPSQCVIRWQEIPEDAHCTGQSWVSRHKGPREGYSEEFIPPQVRLSANLSLIYPGALESVFSNLQAGP